MAPDGVVTGPHVWNPLRSLRPMNMYSPLTLQLWANAHSSPPPTVHVVTVLLLEVEISQLPHPMAVFWPPPRTETPSRTQAAPPLTSSSQPSQAYPNRRVTRLYHSPTLALPSTSRTLCGLMMVRGSKASPLRRM